MLLYFIYDIRGLANIEVDHVPKRTVARVKLNPTMTSCAHGSNQRDLSTSLWPVNRLNGRKAPNLLILLLLRGQFSPPFIPTVVIVDFDELFRKFPISLLDDCLKDLIPKDPWEYEGPCEPVEKTKAENCDASDPRYPVWEGERLCAFSRRDPWHCLRSCQYL